MRENPLRRILPKQPPLHKRPPREHAPVPGWRSPSSLPAERVRLRSRRSPVVGVSLVGRWDAGRLHPRLNLAELHPGPALATSIRGEGPASCLAAEYLETQAEAARGFRKRAPIAFGSSGSPFSAHGDQGSRARCLEKILMKRIG